MNFVFCSLLLLSVNGILLASSNNSVVDSDGFEIISSAPPTEQLKEINTRYLRDVRPIFKEKCLMCHGKLDAYPWYYAIPGVGLLIDQDIADAKDEMDMSMDFPFVGHGRAIDDLESIKRVLEKKRMPPWKYKVFHWNSTLSDDELEVVSSWIKQSIEKLSE